jgi:ABC-2 type transport system permease protein
VNEPSVIPESGPQVSSNASDTGRGVHHLGYRGWSGRTAPGWMRWTVICAVGVRRAWQSTWLRRTLFFAWLPTLWFGLGFFMWEQAVLHPEWRASLTPFLRTMPPTPEFNGIREAIRSGDLEGSRHLVWGWLLQTFFRYPQGVLMVMIIGMIAPPLISQDIRSRAFLLYFSRPLTRGEYILGKLATLWTYLSLISTLPALSLYLMGVLLSPSLNVTFATWDIPFRIVIASVVLMLPTSVLALAMSSLTQESRYAGFAWFAVWVLGWFTFGAATSAEAFNASVQQSGPMVLDNSPWTHLSLYHTLGRVQRWVFGFADFRDVTFSLLILICVTVVSLAILVRRISAPMRV